MGPLSPVCNGRYGVTLNESILMVIIIQEGCHIILLVIAFCMVLPVKSTYPDSLHSLHILPIVVIIQVFG